MVLSALAVAAVFGWLYAQTGTALVSQWLSSADAWYGVALVAVAAVLAWRRRAAFASAWNPAARPTPGLAVLLLGVLVYLVGALGADIFLTRVSSVIVLAGAIAFLCGTAAARVMAAPLAFLLLAIPPPTLVVTALTLPLQTMASRIGEATLAAGGVPVVRDGNLLRLPSATLEIAEACSGLAVAALARRACGPSGVGHPALVAEARADGRGRRADRGRRQRPARRGDGLRV